MIAHAFAGDGPPLKLSAGCSLIRTRAGLLEHNWLAAVVAGSAVATECRLRPSGKLA